MFDRCFLCVWNDFEYGDHCLEIFLPLGAVDAAGALHAATQLSDSNRGEFDLVVGMRAKPCFKVERPSLRLNDDVCIDQKRHGLTCGCKDPRACSKSCNHEVASSAPT